VSHLRSILFFLTALLLPFASMHAQEQPAPTATPAAIMPDNDLRSPRHTVATFLSAMDPSDGELELSQAIKTLDTSEIPDLVRQERSEEVAIKLYAVLSSIGFTPGKVPFSSSEGALQITEVAGYGIYLERNGPNWQFSRVTVSDISTIFREVEPTLSKGKMRALGGMSHTWVTLRTYIPESLKKTTFLIEDWQWLAGALAVIALILLQILVVRMLYFLVTKLAPQGFGVARTRDFKALGRPTFVVIFTIALQLLISTLGLDVDFYTSAVAWITTVRVIALSVLGIYLVESIGDRLQPIAANASTSINSILYPLVQKALWVLVLVVAAVRILTVHGVDVSGLIAGLGLGGLAFALAAKDTVENIFGSVAILLDQPFRIGDNISVAGVTGVVEEIGLRSTRLRTPDNSLISLPNSKVIAGHVDNLGARHYWRSRVIVNVAYGTPPAVIEQLCTAIHTLLLSHPLIKKDAIAVFLHEFNPASLGILVQFHLEVASWIEEQRHKQDIFLAILRAIEALGVTITPPTRELLMSRPGEEPSGAVKNGESVAREVPVAWSRTKGV
jgi:MscS family membrane protein